VRAAEPVPVTLDSCEAEAVLAVLAARRTGQPVEEAAWKRLFDCAGYQRLKRREASMKRDFTDEDFRAFVQSADLAGREQALRETLEGWKRIDVTSAAQRALAYLPAGATLKATVYLVIKPKPNSFVFEAQSDPAIFLYVDPKVSARKLANTVTHELHHIGLASLGPQTGKALASVPEKTRPAVEWLSAFGEGVAMLAAAGSPDVHPHAVSDTEERSRWDKDMAGFAADLRTLERFFLDVIDGRLEKDKVSEKAFTFFGVQGPWYTVGYRMAALVEKRNGRAVLLDCLVDPRRLLLAYNRAAAPEGLPLWSDELLAKMGAKTAE